ncbi:MAG: purine-nucleoside phosphorylase [Methylobacteriaceae bacterium]|nr:purine-nucleoside phosphorylase [Methylobacteriaceae bacterium]MBV9245003.1 purine-nucleoside phosphorylase [Methylobacteriaceae bacterium]MBV9702531.1 purine-nucleoside phosphorylase [Methylobacteriaceae bacterium]
MNELSAASAEAEAAVAFLQSRGLARTIDTAIVLGTGLGALCESAADQTSLPYSEIPGFPRPGVSGHDGRLVFGALEGSRVAFLNGRVHYYEQGDAAAMRVPLQVLALLGARTLILTNSAGSLHSDWYPGSVVVIRDHINLSGTNPLIGLQSDSRFVPMTDAYDERLRKRLRTVAAANGISVRDGVYMWFCGPSFETPAEIRMARQLGADLVGMSTVPEVILARWLGLRVMALSVITNFGAGISGASPTHAETKEVALSGSIGVRRLLRAFLRPSDD